MVENLVPENIPFSAKELLIFLMSEFFCKKSAFFGQNSTFTQSNSVRPVLEILFSVFVRQKVTINENISFTDYVSKIQLPDCSKLVVNWKMAIMS